MKVVTDARQSKVRRKLCAPGVLREQRALHAWKSLVQAVSERWAQPKADTVTSVALHSACESRQTYSKRRRYWLKSSSRALLPPYLV